MKKIKLRHLVRELSEALFDVQERVELMQADIRALVGETLQLAGRLNAAEHAADKAKGDLKNLQHCFNAREHVIEAQHRTINDLRARVAILERPTVV